MVTAQARQSQALLDYESHGLSAPFHEKTQAGPQLLDRRGTPISRLYLLSRMIVEMAAGR